MYPAITYVRGGEDEAGYRVGVALDELVAWAREHGVSEYELHERLDEALERHEEGEG